MMSREERRWRRNGTRRVAVQRKYRLLAREAQREMENAR